MTKNHLAITESIFTYILCISNLSDRYFKLIQPIVLVLLFILQSVWSARQWQGESSSGE